jgi:hypothetical protein
VTLSGLKLPLEEDTMRKGVRNRDASTRPVPHAHRRGDLGGAIGFLVEILTTRRRRAALPSPTGRFEAQRAQTRHEGRSKSRRAGPHQLHYRRQTTLICLIWLVRGSDAAVHSAAQRPLVCAEAQIYNNRRACDADVRQILLCGRTNPFGHAVCCLKVRGTTKESRPMARDGSEFELADS